jgi:hypothetical protein
MVRRSAVLLASSDAASNVQLNLERAFQLPSRDECYPVKSQLYIQPGRHFGMPLREAVNIRRAQDT